MTTIVEYQDLQRRSWERIRGWCSGLTPDQWQTRSLCPDWDIAGVLTHVVGVEKMLTGWIPSTERPPPFEMIGEFELQASALTGDELLARCDVVMVARFDDLDSLEPSVVDQPSFTPTGPGTYGDFLRIRNFDIWVHERDIADPLGISTDDSGLAAELALSEVRGAIGYIVGKRIGLPDGMGITFHIIDTTAGRPMADLRVLVDGRAAEVDQLARPDVEVTADVATFIQLASGRVDPQDRIDSGRITWTGNSQWGERAAKNLRYTR